MPVRPSKRSRKAMLAHVLNHGHLVLSPAARRLIREGFDTMADALSPTLGPTARTVLIESMNRTDPPLFTDDAATVARQIIELPLLRNTGGMLMRHVVWRSFDQVGDGAATTAVIAQALLREATRLIASGANPAILRQGIDAALIEALEALDRLAIPVDTLEAIRRIAVGASHDEAIADKIAEIHERYGWDIVICIQEWLANELAVEVVDGAKWEGGFAASEFITEPERRLAWSEKPLILITNVFLDKAEQVVPIMEQVANAGHKELVFFSPKISDTALATMLVNNERGILHSVGILPPGIGAHKLGVLEDLAAQTGARLFEADAGDKPAFATLDDLGYADLIWASRDFFSVIGGDGLEEDVQERVAVVKAAIESEDAPYDRALLRKRLGYLTGGVATLSVGAATKSEMVERKTRAERAVKAVESGRRDGVVAGGGVALIAAGQAVSPGCPETAFDEHLGRLALIRALEEPLRVIATNSGAEPGPVVHAVRNGRGKVAFDAVHGTFVDPIEAGILDPIKVVRAAVRNGVSAAVMAMLTEALIIPRYRYLHADPKP